MDDSTAGRVRADRALRAGAGAGVGRLLRSETWQPVDLVTLKPQPRVTEAGPGFRVSWTVRF